VHGRDGLGDVPDSFLRDLLSSPEFDSVDLQIPPEKNREVPPENNNEGNLKQAAERLRDLARGKESFDLLCTGPLTNLGVAICSMTKADEQKFWKNVGRFVLMGGNFRVPGNITPAAEFNMFHDPVAAQLVLDSIQRARNGAEFPLALHVIPLDITERLWLELNALPMAQRADAKFLRYSLTLYGRFHALACTRWREDEERKKARARKVWQAQMLGGSGRKEWEPFCFLHDALAAWAMLEPNQFDGYWERSPIRIDTSVNAGRGHVMIVEPKATYMASSTPEVGTEVNWLKPEWERAKEGFINAIREVLEGSSSGSGS